MNREEQIRQRAYEIWRGEGRPEGRDTEHRELAARDIDAIDRQALADVTTAAGVIVPCRPAEEESGLSEIIRAKDKVALRVA
jgi:hypothetical protein